MNTINIIVFKIGICAVCYGKGQWFLFKAITQTIITILQQFSYFYRGDYENNTIPFNYILFEFIKVSFLQTIIV